MKKVDSVSVLSITNNGGTIFGLGSDQMVYQWNMLDASWHAFLVEKERTVEPSV